MLQVSLVSNSRPKLCAKYINLCLGQTDGEGCSGVNPVSFGVCQQDPDAANNVRELTMSTTDLISWSFQIARGMDYLASKKVSFLLRIEKKKRL
jgi:hypothetical protein